MARHRRRFHALPSAEEDRVLHGRRVLVGFTFREEDEPLGPLPFDDFDCGLTLTPKVGRDSRITVRQSQYSVPARSIGRQVRVSLRANELLAVARGHSVEIIDLASSHTLRVLTGHTDEVSGGPFRSPR